ncbi:MAG: hypothetical protein IKW78_01430, partial [Prevotella sp.]|nr:hypothetical protein [Prevotella sp.]
MVTRAEFPENHREMRKFSHQKHPSIPFFCPKICEKSQKGVFLHRQKSQKGVKSAIQKSQKGVTTW